MTTTPDEPTGRPAPQNEPQPEPHAVAPVEHPAAGEQGGYRGGPEYGVAPAGHVPPAGPPRNGLGIAALILGILAVLTFLTLVGGVLLGLLAIVLGLVARGRVKRREATNGGVATAGVILGALGLPPPSA